MNQEPVGFAAYNAGGSDPRHVNLNYQGLPVPAWADLPPNVQEKWKTADKATRQDERRKVLAHLASIGGLPLAWLRQGEPPLRLIHRDSGPGPDSEWTGPYSAVGIELDVIPAPELGGWYGVPRP